MVFWNLQLQKSTLTFLSYWQVSHWLAARGCECSAADVSPRVLKMPTLQLAAHNCTDCGLTIQSSKKEMWWIYESILQIWSDYKFHLSFFSSIDMISALIKISPVEHWVSFFFYEGKIVQIVFSALHIIINLFIFLSDTSEITPINC